jgi:hypothetical protein
MSVKGGKDACGKGQKTEVMKTNSKTPNGEELFDIINDKPSNDGNDAAVESAQAYYEVVTSSAPRCIRYAPSIVWIVMLFFETF